MTEIKELLLNLKVAKGNCIMISSVYTLALPIKLICSAHSWNLDGFAVDLHPEAQWAL